MAGVEMRVASVSTAITELKKYEYVGDTVEVSGVTLHRIRALRNFGDVNAGDLGGYVESDDNLSHENDAWVYGNAHVFGNARVCGNAQVFGNAWVSGNALVYGDAQVFDDARVFDDALVYGNAQVCGNAWVCDDAWVCGNDFLCKEENSWPS